MKGDQSKTGLLAGLILIGFAFLCVLAIFYVIVNGQQTQTVQMENLKTRVDSLTMARDQAKEELDTLKKAPKTMSLQDILKQSEAQYGKDEKNRREGLLWIDRKASTYVITLGALNGLTPGSQLNVYQDNQRVGKLVVETPLDVISYVHPVGKSLKDFSQDYYRVVAE